MPLYPSLVLWPAESLWPAGTPVEYGTQAAATIPHLQWPPALAYDQNGNLVFATVEQDEPAEVQQSLALLCVLRPDMLPWSPQLGIPDPLGAVDPDDAAQEIQDALTDQEPRLPVEVDVLDDPVRGRRLRLRVTVDNE